MPKKLAFEKIHWNGATVHSNQRFIFPFAIIINGFSDEFFAGTAFSGNKSGHIDIAYSPVI